MKKRSRSRRRPLLFVLIALLVLVVGGLLYYQLVKVPPLIALTGYQARIRQRQLDEARPTTANQLKPGEFGWCYTCNGGKGGPATAADLQNVDNQKAPEIAGTYVYNGKRYLVQSSDTYKAAANYNAGNNRVLDTTITDPSTGKSAVFPDGPATAPAAAGTAVVRDCKVTCASAGGAKVCSGDWVFTGAGWANGGRDTKSDISPGRECTQCTSGSYSGSADCKVKIQEGQSVILAPDVDPGAVGLPSKNSEGKSYVVSSCVSQDGKLAPLGSAGTNGSKCGIDGTWVSPASYDQTMNEVCSKSGKDIEYRDGKCQPKAPPPPPAPPAKTPEEIEKDCAAQKLTYDKVNNKCGAPLPPPKPEVSGKGQFPLGTHVADAAQCASGFASKDPTTSLEAAADLVCVASADDAKKAPPVQYQAGTCHPGLNSYGAYITCSEKGSTYNNCSADPETEYVVGLGCVKRGGNDVIKSATGIYTGGETTTDSKLCRYGATGNTCNYSTGNVSTKPQIPMPPAPTLENPAEITNPNTPSMVSLPNYPYVTVPATTGKICGDPAKGYLDCEKNCLDRLGKKAETTKFGGVTYCGTKVDVTLTLSSTVKDGDACGDGNTPMADSICKSGKCSKNWNILEGHFGGYYCEKTSAPGDQTALGNLAALPVGTSKAEISKAACDKISGIYSPQTDTCTSTSYSIVCETPASGGGCSNYAAYSADSSGNPRIAMAETGEFACGLLKGKYNSTDDSCSVNGLKAECRGTDSDTNKCIMFLLAAPTGKDAVSSNPHNIDPNAPAGSALVKDIVTKPSQCASKKVSLWGTNGNELYYECMPSSYNCGNASSGIFCDSAGKVDPEITNYCASKNQIYDGDGRCRERTVADALGNVDYSRFSADNPEQVQALLELLNMPSSAVNLDNVCGPLAFAQLQQAGLIDPSVKLGDFWLADPNKPLDMRTIKNSLVSGMWDDPVDINTSVGDYDFSKRPLVAGDLFYLKQKDFGFTHWVTVNKVENGVAYALTNVMQPDGSFKIQEVQLYNSKNPADPNSMFNQWTTRGSTAGSTGMNGFILWEPKPGAVPPAPPQAQPDNSPAEAPQSGASATLASDLNLGQGATAADAAAAYKTAGDAISACQKKSGVTTGAKLKDCFCQSVDCSSGAGFQIAKNLADTTDKGIQCLQYADIVTSAVLAATPLCEQTAAGAEDQRCLDKDPNGWYYCESPKTLNAGDILVFSGSGSNPDGHIGVCVNGDDSATCTMSSANYHNDGKITNDAVAASKVKGAWRRGDQSKVSGCYYTKTKKMP